MRIQLSGGREIETDLIERADYWDKGAPEGYGFKGEPLPITEHKLLVILMQGGMMLRTVGEEVDSDKRKLENVGIVISDGRLAGN